MQNVSLPAGAVFAPDFMPTIQFEPDADFAAALDSIAPGVSDLTTQQAQTSNQDWIDSLSRLIGVLAIGQQQRDLLRVQVDRARQGLPPLNTSQYTSGASVGLSSDTKMFLGLSVAAVLAVMLFNQGRR